jgi:hypothetical protein
MKIVAVNGVKYTVASFESAVKKSGELTFVVDDYDDVRTVVVHYSGGLKNPHLKRKEDKPDILTPVGAPTVTV